MPIPRSPDTIRTQKKEQNQLKSTQFPENLGDTGMLLMFKQYSFKERETGKAGGVQTISEAKGQGKILASVYLPLPDSLLDATQIGVVANEIGVAGAFAAGSADVISDALAQGSIKPITDALGGIDAKEALGAGAANFMKAGLEAFGLGGVQSGIEAGMGAVANPYQALIFQGVDLKSYSFNWTFAPKSRKETAQIKEIVRLMRYHSLPFYKNIKVSGQNVASGRAFLNYPSVCVPLITGVNTIAFKPCMISQVQIDYGGGGEIAFLEGGDPAAVKVTLTMQEMQIWTREDYDGSYTDPIIQSVPTPNANEGTI